MRKRPIISLPDKFLFRPIVPVFRSLTVNNIATEIKTLNKGVDICGSKLSILMFVDDIVLLGSTKEELQAYWIK